MPMLVINSFMERMIGWEIGCDVYSVFGSISGMGQAITNAAIAFDRYRLQLFRFVIVYYLRIEISNPLFLCRTISCPIDGRLNSKQAAIIIAFTWFWVTPFTALPLLKVWGRYTTGNKFHLSFLGNVRLVLLPYCILLTIPEGFLTTCSFDFLTDDEDTKVFVTCIFIWSYVIPLIFIVLFYSRLLNSIRNHEKMLREQVRTFQYFSIIITILT